MEHIKRGRAHLYGNSIDTDTIIAAKYINKAPMNQLFNHTMEALDPDFVSKVSPGDILVAGKNFGCGSSREVAPMVIRDAGISVVIAESFARIFFRNAINIGLPVLAIGPHMIANHTLLEVDLSKGSVKEVEKEKIYLGNELSPIVRDIITEGGLVNYLKKYKDYQITKSNFGS